MLPKLVGLQAQEMVDGCIGICQKDRTPGFVGFHATEPKAQYKSLDFAKGLCEIGRCDMLFTGPDVVIMAVLCREHVRWDG